MTGLNLMLCLQAIKETNDIHLVEADKVLRDLDFERLFSEGIKMPGSMHYAIIAAIRLDSFRLQKIATTDYSLLLGYRPLNPDETPVTYGDVIDQM